MDPATIAIAGIFTGGVLLHKLEVWLIRRSEKKKAETKVLDGDPHIIKTLELENFGHDWYDVFGTPCNCLICVGHLPPAPSNMLERRDDPEPFRREYNIGGAKFEIEVSKARDELLQKYNKKFEKQNKRSYRPSQVIVVPPGYNVVELRPGIVERGNRPPAFRTETTKR